MSVSEKLTERISTFLIAHTVHCCGWFIVITVLLMVTVVTVITAYIYWRCYRFHSSDFSVRDVNVELNAGSGRNLLSCDGGRGALRIYLICVEFKNHLIKSCHYYKCNIGLFSAAFM